MCIGAEKDVSWEREEKKRNEAGIEESRQMSMCFFSGSSAVQEFYVCAEENAAGISYMSLTLCAVCRRARGIKRKKRKRIFYNARDQGLYAEARRSSLVMLNAGYAKGRSPFSFGS